MKSVEKVETVRNVNKKMNNYFKFSNQVIKAENKAEAIQAISKKYKINPEDLFITNRTIIIKIKGNQTV